jgi:hypothetical protein
MTRRQEVKCQSIARQVKYRVSACRQMQGKRMQNCKTEQGIEKGPAWVRSRLPAAEQQERMGKADADGDVRRHQAARQGCY